MVKKRPRFTKRKEGTDNKKRNFENPDHHVLGQRDVHVHLYVGGVLRDNLEHSNTVYNNHFVFTAGNAQATMNINIKPQPGEFPSSEEIDKPMNQQDPGTVLFELGDQDMLTNSSNYNFTK